MTFPTVRARLWIRSRTSRNGEEALSGLDNPYEFTKLDAYAASVLSMLDTQIPKILMLQMILRLYLTTKDKKAGHRFKSDNVDQAIKYIKACINAVLKGWTDTKQLCISSTMKEPVDAGDNFTFDI